jgi:hypothetical protein
MAILIHRTLMRTKPPNSMSENWHATIGRCPVSPTTTRCSSSRRARGPRGGRCPGPGHPPTMEAAAGPDDRRSVCPVGRGRRPRGTIRCAARSSRQWLSTPPSAVASRGSYGGFLVKRVLHPRVPLREVNGRYVLGCIYHPGRPLWPKPIGLQAEHRLPVSRSALSSCIAIVVRAQAPAKRAPAGSSPVST